MTDTVTDTEDVIGEWLDCGCHSGQRDHTCDPPETSDDNDDRAAQSFVSMNPDVAHQNIGPVWDAVRCSVVWLNTYHEPDTTEITMRLLKVTEEAGEVAQAWIGAAGQNPRKGVTHSRDDVAAELADVVFAALVAITSLGLNPHTVLIDKARMLITRMNGPVASVDIDTDPEYQVHANHKWPGDPRCGYCPSADDIREWEGASPTMPKDIP